MENKELYEKLEKLELTTSFIEKEDIIIDLLNTVPESEQFFRIALDKNIIFNVKEKTFWNAYGIEINNDFSSVSDWLYNIGCPADNFGFINLEIFIDFCDNVEQLSGDSLKENIYRFFSGLNQLQRKWFSRVILHDLRCGVQLKTMNRCLRSLGLPLIEKFSVQLCGTIENIYQSPFLEYQINTYGSVVAELKYNGYRIIAEHWSDGRVKLMSRRGKDKTKDYPWVVAELQKYFVGQHIVLDGEMIAASWQALANKNTDTSKRVYVIYDLLIDRKLDYKDRYTNLLNLLGDVGILSSYTENIGIPINNINNKVFTSAEHLTIAEHYNIYNMKELQEYYEEINRRGEEGIVIKLPNTLWIPDNRTNWWKVKQVLSADLKIIGWNYGEGKRAHGVGSLQLIDKSGTIRCDVGSGITDDVFDELTGQIEGNGPPAFVGKICEILYNAKTETGSLWNPRFVTIRDDKNEADNLS